MFGFLRQQQVLTTWRILTLVLAALAQIAPWSVITHQITIWIPGIVLTLALPFALMSPSMIRPSDLPGLLSIPLFWAYIVLSVIQVRRPRRVLGRWRCLTLGLTLPLLFFTHRKMSSEESIGWGYWLMIANLVLCVFLEYFSFGSYTQQPSEDM